MDGKTIISTELRLRQVVNLSSPYLKGKRAEYELVNLLKRSGYAVMRAPASGARAKKVFYPDVMAVKFDGVKHKVLIFEVKLRDERETVYIAGPKYWMLRDYAQRAGGKALLAVKVSKEGRWFLFPIEWLEEQVWKHGKRYVLRVEMYDRGLSLSDVL